MCCNENIELICYRLLSSAVFGTESSTLGGETVDAKLD